MRQNKLLIPVVFLVLVACNSQESRKDEHHDNHQNSEKNKEQKGDNHEREPATKNVQLDNGKKWKANPETITGINKMYSLVQDGIAGRMERAKLHDTLRVEFKTIFDKCTMTGESHNQLHNYLLPLKARLEQLKAGNTESLEEMQKHLSTFKNYFE